MGDSVKTASLSRNSLLTTARLLGALLLAGLATQTMRSEQPSPLDSILFVLASVVLFIWAVYHTTNLEQTSAEIPAQASLSRPSWTGLGVGLALAALSWPLFSGNRLHPLGLILLAAGIALVVLAVRQDAPAPSLPGNNDILDPRLRTLALLSIVILGAIFRLYHLDGLPSDMFNDLAHIYQETDSILRGNWMIYGTVFPGREPLLFYLNALLAQISGLNFFTLKLSTALIGIVTLPVIYLLGRQAYNDAVGLVAALFLAVAKWHVLISRVGFRGILTPLTTALGLYFLLRGLQQGRRGDLLWAGAWFGLGLYGYTAALATIPAMILGLGLYALAGHARELWHMRRSLLLAALIAVLVALPLLRFMLVDGRELFWFRPLTRVSEQETDLPEPLGKLLLQNLLSTAGMFHVRGDIVFRTNIPNDPQLGGIAGTFFLLGFPLVLARWRRGSNVLLLAFFLVLLLPTTLALAFPMEVPGAVRSGGAMATVMIFSAVAAVTAWQQLGQVLPSLRGVWGWGGLLTSLALLSGVYNAHLCFVEYPEFLPYRNYPLFREIAGVIDELGDDGPVLLKSIPHWDDKDAIRFQTRQHQNWSLSGEIITQIDPDFLANLQAPQAAVILHPERDRESLEALRRIFPQGTTWLYRDQQGQVQFAVFLFNQEGAP